MTYNQTPAAQQMMTFTAHLRDLITTAHFEDDLAASLWIAMKADAERNLGLLEEATANLKGMDSAEYHQFSNIIEFSRTTLRWAQDDELALIEALSETSALLLKRLKAVQLVMAPEQAAISRLLAPQSHTPVPGYSAVVQAFLDRLTSRKWAQVSGPPLPDWNNMTASEKTPTQVGVYS